MTMAATDLKTLLIGLAMLVAAGLALALTPRTKMADQGPRVDLETMIPRRFGDWRVDETLAPLVVNPQIQANLDKLYSSSLTRTYLNSSGYRVMLSIAYGGNQLSDDSQVHRPEYCYKAQGFQLDRVFEQSVRLEDRSLLVRRLQASHADRHEPITYWITIGDRATLPGLWRKITQLKYGLTGTIPDGLLFRVSSIDHAAEEAYRIQDQFVRDLLSKLGPAEKRRLIGNS